MIDEKPPGTASEVLMALHEFLLEPEVDVTTIPMKKVMSDLQSQGIDPSPLIKEVRISLAKLRAQSELEEAARKRKSLTERLWTHVEERINRPVANKEQTLKQLRNYFSGGQSAGAYFKNLEGLSEADLQSMLQDTELMDLLEKIDAEA